MTFHDLLVEALPAARVIWVKETSGILGPIGVRLDTFVIDKTEVEYALQPERIAFRHSIADQVRTWFRAQGSPPEVALIERTKTWGVYTFMKVRKGDERDNIHCASKDQRIPT